MLLRKFLRVDPELPTSAPHVVAGPVRREAPHGLPGERQHLGPEVWVVFRRSLGETRELKVFPSNAPAEAPVPEMGQREASSQYQA